MKNLFFLDEGLLNRSKSAKSPKYYVINKDGDEKEYKGASNSNIKKAIAIYLNHNFGKGKYHSPTNYAEDDKKFIIPKDMYAKIPSTALLLTIDSKNKRYRKITNLDLKDKYLTKDNVYLYDYSKFITAAKIIQKQFLTTLKEKLNEYHEGKYIDEIIPVKDLKLDIYDISDHFNKENSKVEGWIKLIVNKKGYVDYEDLDDYWMCIDLACDELNAKGKKKYILGTKEVDIEDMGAHVFFKIY